MPRLHVRAVSVLSVVALLVATAHLIRLNWGQLDRLQRLTRFKMEVPPEGSLAGIGVNGVLMRPQPAEAAPVLVFVVRSHRADVDRTFWNEAIEALRTGGHSVTSWGVCDAGRACDHLQPQSRFSIVSFLDPFQMRVVANADAGRAGLLYDSKGRLLGLVRRDTTPAAVAKQVTDLIN